jgi:hypothetical protein
MERKISGLVQEQIGVALDVLETSRRRAKAAHGIGRILSFGFIGQSASAIDKHYDGLVNSRKLAEMRFGPTAKSAHDLVVSTLRELPEFRDLGNEGARTLRAGEMALVPSMSEVRVRLVRTVDGQREEATIKFEMESERSGYVRVCHIADGVETPLCKDLQAVRVGNNNGYGAVRLSLGSVVGQPPVGTMAIVENFLSILAPAETRQHSVREQPLGSYADPDVQVGGSLGEVGEAQFSKHKLLDVTRFLESDTASPLREKPELQRSLQWLAHVDIAVHYLPARDCVLIRVCPRTASNIGVFVAS